MAVTKFLTVGDVHLADKSPQSRVDDYRETVFGKLDMVRMAADKLFPAAVLFTGDIFHLEKPIRNSHSLVRALIDKLLEFPCPCYCVPGNHDLRNDRMDTLPEQPLGVVFSSGAMIQLTPEGELFHCFESGRIGVGDPPRVQVGETTCLIETDPGPLFKIRVAGTDYSEMDPLPKCHAVKKGRADYLITVGHFYSGLEGCDYYGKPCISYHDMAETETDLWVMGHFHNDRGIQQVGGKYFVGLGSLTRGALDDDNLARNVKIGLVELEKEGGVIRTTLKAIRLPVAPPEEIFDLVRHEEIKQEREAMDAFMQDLQENFDESQEMGLDELNPMVMIEQLNIEAPVRDEMLRRVREAETQ